MNVRTVYLGGAPLSLPADVRDYNGRTWTILSAVKVDEVGRAGIVVARRHKRGGAVNEPLQRRATVFGVTVAWADAPISVKPEPEPRRVYMGGGL